MAKCPHYIIIRIAILSISAILLFGHLGAVCAQGADRQLAEEHRLRRFTMNGSLARLSQIRSALESFRLLTQRVKRQLTAKDTEDIGNLKLDLQILGFVNWPNDIEGALRYQQHQISKLEYELHQELFRSGKISQGALQAKEAAMMKSKESFTEFLGSFTEVD